MMLLCLKSFFLTEAFAYSNTIKQRTLSSEVTSQDVFIPDEASFDDLEQPEGRVLVRRGGGRSLKARRISLKR